MWKPGSRSQSNSPTVPDSPAVFFERLEPKILLSADALFGLVAADPFATNDSAGLDIHESVKLLLKTVDSDSGSSLVTGQSDSLSLDALGALLETPDNSESRQEIIFVDVNTPDYQQLVDGLQQNPDIDYEVFTLESNRDGVEQISEVLSGFDDIDAVHLISHGNGQGLQLGNSWFGQESLDNNAQAISNWSSALTTEADFLIYGCNLAADVSGLALINTLAELTGADVAASDDLTGAAAQGGDWQLEYSSGDIESGIVISTSTQQTWDNVLGTITVTTTQDVVDGDADMTSLANLAINPGSDGFVSLREAIIAANFDTVSGLDEINLGAGTYKLTLLGTPEDASASGDLDIRDGLNIIGAGAGQTFIDGDGKSRVMQIIGDTAFSVSISNLTIEKGDASTVGENSGAGLHIGSLPFAPVVTLDNVWFFDNRTGGGGDSGGAIFNRGDLTITNSLIEKGSAEAGGGIMNFLDGTLSMTNVTLSDNTATGGDGGGLFNAETATLLNVTVANNQATGAGGGVHSYAANSATTTINNTLIAYNSAGSNADIDGAFVSNTGDNLVENAGTASGLHVSDITGVDPLLGNLDANGGTTKTHALLAGSTAINAASPGIAPLDDQRGYSRDVAADIGAYEFNGVNSDPTLDNTIPDQYTIFGTLFSFTFDANTFGDADAGEVLTYRASLSGGGALPTWLNFDASTRTFSGTASNTDFGQVSIVVTADDGSGGLVASDTFVIVVDNPEFVVNSTDDTVDINLGDGLAIDAAGNTSLRAAIMEANALAGSDTIILGAATYLLDLPGIGDGVGDLNVESEISIEGVGAGLSIIDGGGIDRVFEIASGNGNLTLSDLTVQGGDAGVGFGGGIWVNNPNAELNMNRVDVIGNQAAEGGGIYSKGSTWLTDVTIASNNALVGAGVGGGLYNWNFAVLNNVTVSGNTANQGGGIYNVFQTNLTNVTLSGNTATVNEGGGLYNASTANLQNVTISNNTAQTQGGGIFNGNTVTISNTIVANNTSVGGTGHDVSGAFTSDGSNIVENIGPATGFGGDTMGDPNLGGLASNGGFTQTHALLAGSIAIDSLAAAAAPADDQRGAARDGSPDIGAYEFAASLTATGALWITSADDVASPSNAPGLDSWTAGDVLSFDNPDLTFDPTGSPANTTDGNFSSAFNLDNLVQDSDARLSGLHYIQSDITVGSGVNTFLLEAGDILFSTRDSETLQSNNSVFVTEQDLSVFEPDTPGDYGSGTFTMLLDGSQIPEMSIGLHGLTLAESDTIVGDSTVQAGTFLLLDADNSDVFHYTADEVGDGTTSGTWTTLIDGADINIDQFPRGIDLIETTADIGGTTLSAGSILMSLNFSDGSVGDNNISVEREDIFYLTVTKTEWDQATTVADATLFFDGSDVGLDTANERVHGLTLAANNPPVAADDSYSVNQDTVLNVNAATGLLANDSDPDPDPLTAYVVDGPTDGALSIAPLGVINDTNLSNNLANDRQPMFSPDGSMITFKSDRVVAGLFEIYTMNADGSNVTQLTFDGAVAGSPAWSPDGLKLSFFSDKDGNDEIYTINADGTGLARLTNNAFADLQSNWSPDGTQIVFCSNRDGGDQEIYVMDADGSNQTRLTFQAGADNNPAWSPDGSKITFTSNRDSNFNIYTMNADGSGVMRITTDVGNDRAPRFSPDGAHIVFNSQRDGDNELFVINADGSNEIQLTNNNVINDLAPAWSPDGTQMVFETDRDGNSQIYLVDLLFDGSFEYTPDSGFTGGDSFTYAANDGTEDSNIASAAITVNNTNITPTFTVLASPVDTTTEDSEVAVSFADLTTAGDENDADGTVDAFVVKSISTGTLNIGATAGSATAWASGTNDIIDASNNAYWTPGLDDTGIQNAFAVVAQDDGGQQSVSNVTVQIDVTAQNDAPLLGNNSLVLDQSDVVALDNSMLSATDVDNADAGLTFTVSNVSNGYFAFAADITTPVITFDQSDITAGTVRFLHDGGELTPAYDISVSDGTISTAADAASISFSGTGDGVLWLSMALDEGTSSGIPGLDTTDLESGDVLQHAGPDFALGEAGTDGNFTIAFNASDFAGNEEIRGMHYVTNSVTIGGANAIVLQAGDLLLTSHNAVTFTSNGAGAPGPLNTNGPDIFYFRPDTPGDYSQGNFYMLLSDPFQDGANIDAISLVEKKVLVGDVWIDKGDLLLTRSGAGVEDNDVWLLQTDTLDPTSGATYPAALLLIEGDDPGVDIDEKITGLDLLEQNETIGGQVFAAGTLLISVDDDEVDGIGSTAKVVDEQDIVALQVVKTTLGSGATNAVVNASLFFDGDDVSGNDVNFDTVNEGIDGFSLTTYITPPNAAPLATNLSSISAYAEGDVSVPITNIVVSDADSGETIIATLTLADTSTGSLSANNGASYTAGTGVWTITDTVANVNTALANLVFNPNTNNDLDTTISVNIDDGDEDASGALTGTITLDVTPVNDAPGATNLSSTASYTEGDGNVAIDDIVVSDVDTGESITATLTLANILTGSLSANDGASYNALSGVWTITGTVADVNTALANLVFNPLLNNDVDTSIAVSIDDGDEDASGALTGTIIIDGNPANDAPTATNLSSTSSYTEGDTNIAIDDIVVSDVDTGESIIATLTLANTGTGSLSANNGASYTAGTGVWTITGTVTNVNTALANLVFNPNTNNDLNTSISVNIDDGDEDASGALTGTIDLNVTAANDAPGATNLSSTAGYNEGDASVSITDIVVSDVDTGESITATLILTNTATGSLSANNGASYTAGTGVWTITDTVANVNTALANLVFNPTTNNDLDTTISVNIDDGDEDASGALTGTITLDVTPSNDAPGATNLSSTTGYNEGDASVAITDIVVSDGDTGENITATLTLTNTATGSLSANNGASYTAGTGVWTITGTVTNVNTALANLVFNPTTNNDLDTTISVDIDDGDEDASGALTGTIDLNVTVINDAPGATNLSSTAGYNEGTASVAIDDIVVSDVDTGETITATLTLTNVATGSLSANNGASYTAGTGVWTITGTVANVNTALANLVFNPTTNNDLDTTISVNIDDGDEDASGALTGTISLDVTPANNAPDATNLTSTAGYNEGEASVAITDIVVSDVDTGENITATLTLTNTATGSLSANNGASYTAGTGVWTITDTVANVNTALANLVFNPTTNNDLDTTISVNIDDGDEDASGALTGTIFLDVTPVNDAPGATNLSSTAGYNEGDASVAITDIVVSDVDTSETITATLILANTETGSLSANNGASYSAGTGVWTITGTVANVNTALANLVFNPTTNNDLDTTISVNIDDGDEDASGALTGTIDLNVTAVNDAPGATNLSGTASYTEGDASVAIDDIVVSDVDTGETITATLTLTNTATGSLSANNGASYTAGTGVWTITGTVANVNIALANLVFNPTTNNDLDTTISVNIDDGDEDASGALTGTISLDVTPVNDAPVLAAIGNQSIDELATLIFTATATDNDLPADNLNFSLDAASLAKGMSIDATTGVFSWTPSEIRGGKTSSVTIMVTDNGTGNLVDSETITITVNEVNVAPVLAAIGDQSIAELATLSFTATATDSDIPGNDLSFSLDAASIALGMSIDATSGTFSWTPTVGQGGLTPSVTITVTDDGTGSLVDSETITISVNDVPVLGNNNLVISEAATVTVTPAMLSATDVDNADGLLVFNVSAVSGGQFELTSSPGTSITSFTQNQLSSNLVVFVDDGDETAPTFNVGVTDGTTPSAVVAGGVSFSNVNDEPVATGNTVVTNEDLALVFGVADFNFSDAETDSLVSVTISGLNLNGGTLTHSAGLVNVSNGMTITAAQLADLTFTPAPDDTTDSSFIYTVNDADTGITSASMTIIVNALNDAPTASNLSSTASYTEGDVAVAITDIVVSDVDAAEVISATLTLADTTTGSLSANDGASYNTGSGVWTITDTVTNVNTALANLVFTPTTHNDLNTSIGVNIDDANEDGGAALTGTINLNVTAVNDAPSASNLNNNTGYFYGEASLALNDIVITDVDNGEIVTATLTLNNVATGSLSANNGASYDASSGVWTITGSVSQVNTALANLSFIPAKGNTLDSTIAVSIDDADEDNSGPLLGAMTISVNALPAVTAAAPEIVTVVPDEPELEVEEEVVVETVTEEPVEKEPVLEKAAGNLEVAGGEPVVPVASNDLNTGLQLDLVEKFENENLTVGANDPVRLEAVVLVKPLAVDVLVMNLREQIEFLNNPLMLIGAESFITKLNDMREALVSETENTDKVVGSSLSVTAGFSVGYVVWLARSGVLLSSVLSSMPAWRFIDPLPVLAGLQGVNGDEDDESLESMVEEKGPDEKSAESHKGDNSDI